MANLEELFDSQIFLKERDNIENYLSGNTNKIFYNTEVKSDLTYYLPAYLRLSFNSISGLDFNNLKAEAHCDIFLTLNVKDLPDSLARHVKNNIILYFANDQEILVKENNEYDEQEPDEGEDEDEGEIYFQEEKEKENGVLVNHYIHFQIRRSFKTNMVASIFLTPFEDIDLILMVSPRINSMNVTDIPLTELNPANLDDPTSAGHNLFPAEFIEKFQDRRKTTNPKRINFLINLMDSRNLKHETLNYGIIKDFGNYSVADKKLYVEYSNVNSASIIIERSRELNNFEEEFDEEINLNKIKNFEYAHFVIRIFRNPNSVAFTIFIPVVLLTIINLGIFFQSSGLAGRIENIAGLMFAYTAIIPVIRSQIPTNPSVTLIEFLVYLLTCTTLLCLVEGVIVRNRTDYQASNKNPFFLASLIISVLSALIVIVLIIWHHGWRLKNLTENLERDFRREKFNHQTWANEECDKHFMKFFDSGRVKSVHSLFKEEKSKE